MINVSWEKEEVKFAVPRFEPENMMGGRPWHDDTGDQENKGGTPVYPQQQPMVPSRPPSAAPCHCEVTLGAIDNSLAFPWKHPDQWRSFPFGWLFLPVGLIGKPFSQRTRDHFLPLLTSSTWWTDTVAQFRDLFSQDSDFKERMFARQMAVLKGQAWNVVESLKQEDHGPLELTRRPRVHVWSGMNREEFEF